MTHVKKLIVLLALSATILLPLSACNTIEGIGKDTRAAGESLENAARSNK